MSLLLLLLTQKIQFYNSNFSGHPATVSPINRKVKFLQSNQFPHRLPCRPFRVEQGEGTVVDKSKAVVRPVTAELDPGREALRTEVEVVAFDAANGDPRVCKDVLKEGDTPFKMIEKL